MDADRPECLGQPAIRKTHRGRRIPRALVGSAGGALLAVALAACGGAQPAAVAPSSPPAAGDGASLTAAQATAASASGKRAAKNVAAAQLDAPLVVCGFQRRGLPVGDVQRVTAESDPDHLLGVPGQYSSRVDFQDSTLAVQGAPFDLVNGGVVEVFATQQDAQSARRALTAGGPHPGEVDTVHGPVLLRLSTRINPAQQAAYGAAVNDVLRALRKSAARAGGAAPTPTPAVP